MSMLTILAAAGALCASPVVHDGDTIRCGAERVRIANIDAPELPGSPKCGRRRYGRAPCDFAAGFAARAALVQLLDGKAVMIERQGVDRYGRTLALVKVGQIDVGEWLVAHGFARRWW